LRSHCHDFSRELVSENLRVLRSGQRVRLDRCHDRPSYILVEIGAADAARRDANDNLIVERFAWL
jgi:hypothetical protein